MIITIDGPSGSGKSSIARALAARYHLHHLATSLLYRAVGFVLSRCWDAENAEHRWKTLTDVDYEVVKNILYDIRDNEARLLYKNEDITSYLFEEKIAGYASQVSEDSRVRELLLDKQRNIAKMYDIVADGRDCGSVLFPDADVKLYVTASVDVRARRMMQDSSRWANNNKSFDAIKADLIVRDKRDTERIVAPLVVPEGALIIDTTDMPKDSVLQQIFHYLDQNVHKKRS